MCAVKNSISPGYGLLEFLKLKIGLEVFLNFFFHVYINEGVNGVPLKSVISKILAKKSVISKI